MHEGLARALLTPGQHPESISASETNFIRATHVLTNPRGGGRRPLTYIYFGTATIYGRNSTRLCVTLTLALSR